MSKLKQSVTFNIDVADNGYLVTYVQEHTHNGKTFICQTDFDVQETIRKILQNEVEYPKHTIGSYA